MSFEKKKRKHLTGQVASKLPQQKTDSSLLDESNSPHTSLESRSHDSALRKTDTPLCSQCSNIDFDEMFAVPQPNIRRNRGRIAKIDKLGSDSVRDHCSLCSFLRDIALNQPHFDNIDLQTYHLQAYDSLSVLGTH